MNIHIIYDHINMYVYAILFYMHKYVYMYMHNAFLFACTLNEEAEVVDRLVPDVSESMEPCRRRLFSDP